MKKEFVVLAALIGVTITPAFAIDSIKAEYFIMPSPNSNFSQRPVIP